MALIGNNVSTSPLNGTPSTPPRIAATPTEFPVEGQDVFESSSFLDRTKQVIQRGAHAVGHALDEVFGSHLEVKRDASGKPSLINTTGDILDPTKMIPKANAVVAHGKDGKDYVLVGLDADGKRRWLDKSEFQESDGKDGVLYIPEYKSSKMGSAMAGGVRGFAALATLGPLMGLLGAGVGAGAGIAAQALPTDNTALKVLAGAGIGAAALAAAGLLLAGGAAAIGLAIVGACLGASGTLAGEGQGKVRDAAYAGTMLGAFVPGAASTLPIAAALGAKAKNPIVQGLISAGLAAGLTATVAVALGSAPVVVGLLAAGAAGAAAPGLGRVVMNTIRNGSELVKKVLHKPVEKVLNKLGDNALCAVTGLPLAFLGATIGAVVSPWVGAAAALALGVVGAVKTKKWLNKLAAQHQEKVAAFEATAGLPAGSPKQGVTFAPRSLSWGAPPPGAQTLKPATTATAPLPEPKSAEMCEVAENIRAAQAEWNVRA